MKAKVFTTLMAAVLSSPTPTPADAGFHLMQIEQVIGGVNGDTSAQAIQLRLRFPGETLLEFARIRAWDSAGANPITLIDFDASVPPSGVGARVLITSPSFATYTETPLTSDFILTSLIPNSYLAAGRITYEQDNGDIFWSLSFGGAAYTGPTTGLSTNDADGEFGPPFDGPCPSGTTRALQFQGVATDPSSTNANDYELTTGPAVFTNNAGVSSEIVPPALPLLSEWGLVVLSLLVATAGTVILARRRAPLAESGNKTVR
ncbi:MAG: IPTL-CTERM sorting domain-containing protein [Phycisphaerae bacterium]